MNEYWSAFTAGAATATAAWAALAYLWHATLGGLRTLRAWWIDEERP